MTRSPRLASLCACALALTLAVASCSSGGDKADDKTTTTKAGSSTTAEVTTSTEQTTTTAADEPSDDPDAEAMARATAVQITIDDLSDPGWTASPHETSEASMLDTCSPDQGARILARTNSDDFTFQTDDGGSLQLSSGTAVMRSGPAARALITAISTPDFIGCANEGFREQLQGMQVEGEFQASDPLPDLGEQAIAIGADMKINDPATGEVVELHILMTFIRTGGIASYVTMMATNTDLDEPTLYPLFDLIAERQAA